MSDKKATDRIGDYSQGADASIDARVLALLLLLVAIGFAFRVTQLDAIGFAEDEVNKVDAVRAYERGDITANAEHPMLMKALMYVSIHAGRAIAGGRPVSDEFWFRLPNAIVGSLTVFPLFLLTAAFFDRWIGLLAAGFWSCGVNAITFNRIGKEDTLLVFFMLFAFYFYLRAKQTDSRKTTVRSRNYLLSGASFGLMMASKYFPHYLGLNSLYHHYVRVRKREPDEPSGKTSLIFYVAMLLAFLIANPPVLLPQVWSYVNAYMSEKLLAHSGYLFADQLYKNNTASSPFWGTPIYFYLLFMAIKIPILVLSTFVTGFIAAVRRWRHPGHAYVLFMFLFWIVPYSLVASKWLRYTLSLMPFIYIFSAIGVAVIINAGIAKIRSRKPRSAFLAATVLVFIGLPAVAAYSRAPHYALYTNAFAANRVGYFFPHDEFYDVGLREAIKYVCETAPQNATIAHETPAATRYYLAKFARADLNSRPISSRDFDPANISGNAFIIVQRGRTYFENESKLEYVRANFRKIYEVKIQGMTAVEVFLNQR